MGGYAPAVSGWNFGKRGGGRFWTLLSFPYLSDYRDIPMSLDSAASEQASKCIIELYYTTNHFSFEVSKSVEHPIGVQTNKASSGCTHRAHPSITWAFCALWRSLVTSLLAGGERPDGLARWHAGYPPSRRHVTAYACGLFGTGRQEGVRWTA